MSTITKNYLVIMAFLLIADALFLWWDLSVGRPVKNDLIVNVLIIGLVTQIYINDLRKSKKRGRK